MLGHYRQQEAPQRCHQQIPHRIDQPERHMYLAKDSRTGHDTDQQHKNSVPAMLHQRAASQRQANAQQHTYFVPPTYTLWTPPRPEQQRQSPGNRDTDLLQHQSPSPCAHHRRSNSNDRAQALANDGALRQGTIRTSTGQHALYSPRSANQRQWHGKHYRHGLQTWIVQHMNQLKAGHHLQQTSQATTAC